ncbi:cbb3-type cytochrome oxidase assembly protein CcoS [bacterium]|jgi:cbb3-type cytochrome oxidase maturation protein|nr:cbb3-type cytochrome oxidase assembly protein CcoS [bacterium]
MNILYYLIPITFCIVTFFVIAFIWTVKTGQYDDLDTPSQKLMIDDD